mgnify:CR=1 FL=1
MSIWGAPIADHLGGQEMLDKLIDDDIIEIYPLSHIRGRSLHNAIVLCDECENMNDKLVTLLMSRIEDDSQLIFCGDGDIVEYCPDAEFGLADIEPEGNHQT